MSDHFDLDRFHRAQERSYGYALQEIRDGMKLGHWIWFVFPQIQGLGMSDMCARYSIESLEEAEAYMQDPVLSDRLIEISEALLEHRDKTAREILGGIDAIKVRSCMTLFELVSDDSIFGEVLDVFYEGERDGMTYDILRNMGYDV